MRNAFFKVMRREHPWYTIINVASFIDSPALWRQFKKKLLIFGYNQIMVEIYYALGRYRGLVSFAVKIKRKIIRIRGIHRIKEMLYHD